MLTNFSRILRFAFIDFLRNKGISLAAIFILVVTVMLATSLLFFWGVSNYLIVQIQDKIDITAYFKEEVEEQNIFLIKNEVSKSSVVKTIEYVSKEKALEDFKARYGNNEVLAKALFEVGGNPFLPSLNIKTDGSLEQFKEVSDILSKEEFSTFIEKVDFSEKKDIINRVFLTRSAIIKAGLILGIILILIAIMVVFNTIKLTVNSLQEEISTMKIVGATNWFIRGPFIIQGAIYGFVSFAICFILSLIIFYLLKDKIYFILPGFNSFVYFISNVWLFIAVQVGFGVGVGIISSFIAVRRHLKV